MRQQSRSNERSEIRWTRPEAKQLLSEVEFDLATKRNVSVLKTGSFDTLFIAQRLRHFLYSKAGRAQSHFVLE